MSNRKKVKDKDRRSKIYRGDYDGLSRDQHLDVESALKDAEIALGKVRSEERKLLAIPPHMRDGKIMPLMMALNSAEVNMVVMFRLITVMHEFINQPGIGSKWSYEETERAVEWKAEGKSLEWIALKLDRTVQAVAARITQAVGIQQTEVHIKGIIDGRLENEHADGMFEGTLRKARS